MDYILKFENNLEIFNCKSNNVGYMLIKILNTLKFLKIDLQYKDFLIIANTDINNELIFTENNYIYINNFEIPISENEFIVLKKLIILLDKYIKICSKHSKYYNVETFAFLINIEIPNKSFNISNNTTNISSVISYTDVSKTFEKEIDNVLSNINNKNIQIQYNCKSLNEIIIVSMIECISKNKIIKKCNLCCNYFIPKKSDTMFCDNLISDMKIYKKYPDKKLDETCKQYNNRIGSYKNMNEITKTIRRVKSNIKARIIKGNETQEYLKDWEYNVSKLKNKTKEGYTIKQIIQKIEETDINSRKIRKEKK